MGKPAAKLGDQVVRHGHHIVMVRRRAGPVPTPRSFPSTAASITGCVRVLIEGKPAAVHAGVAMNLPPRRSNWRNIPASARQPRTSDRDRPLCWSTASRGQAATSPYLQRSAPAPVGTVVATGRYCR